MSRLYIYTVLNAVNNRIIAVGSSRICADAIKASHTAIQHAARMSECRERYFLKGKYIVTRRVDNHIHIDSYYYEVRLRKTGELVCAGTSEECAKMLGLPDVARFRAMIYNQRTGKVRKWNITSVPYASVSPEMVPIQVTNNSAENRINHHKNTDTKVSKSAFWYSVYLKATDELICSGTSLECAKALGMKSRADFCILVHKVKKGIIKKYEIYSEPYYKNEEE